MKTTILYTALVALFACGAPIAAQSDPNCIVDRCMVIGLDVSYLFLPMWQIERGMMILCYRGDASSSLMDRRATAKMGYSHAKKMLCWIRSRDLKWKRTERAYEEPQHYEIKASACVCISFEPQS